MSPCTNIPNHLDFSPSQLQLTKPSFNIQEKHLLVAKEEVEDAYHANFWSNVSASMERLGAKKYPAAFIQKMFRELEAAGKTDIDAAASTSETNGANDDSAMKEEGETGDGANVA